jgi:hypothetical protein
MHGPWKLTREPWSLGNTETSSPEINFGTVIGCALVESDDAHESKEAKIANEKLWRSDSYANEW